MLLSVRKILRMNTYDIAGGNYMATANDITVGNDILLATNENSRNTFRQSHQLQLLQVM